MYATPTFAGFEPGDLMDMREVADFLDLSPFTIRTQWQDYGLPFEWVGGRRLARRSSVIAWKEKRDAAKAEKAARNAAFSQSYEQRLANGK